jgi:uncharacterized protein YbjT (DUF2867 family)
MNILVLGATGETGRRVVQAALAQGHWVRACVRDTEAARSILPGEVEIVVGNVLDRASLEGAIAGCEAVICATGARPSFDITGPFQVDYLGTRNLVDVAQGAGVQAFVLISSLCVSRLLHPLNLFWLVLFWKQQAEQYLRQSGVPYTIVRPGGLRNEDADTPILMQSADTLFEGSIPRSQVAKVAIAALGEPSARNKVVEVVSRADIPAQPLSELFSRVI